MNTKNKKPRGYWNDIEKCLNEAKKYRNKSEFHKNCYGAYHSLIKNNCIMKLNNLYDITVLYKGYDEKIHNIYVYKFEEYNCCYVGRTTNIVRRKRQHENGCCHKNGNIKYETPKKFAIGKNIKLTEPVILENNLNAKESQDRELYWCMYFKENGWELLNKAPTGIGVSSLGSVIKWDYESCKNEAIKYKKKYEFKLKNQSAYKTSVKHKWIDGFYVQTKKPNGYWNNKENCINAAKKYRNIKEFSIKCGGAYNKVKKNGWTKLLIFEN